MKIYIILLFAIFYFCDTPKTPYLTTYNRSELLQLMKEKGKMCIVSFSVDSLLYDSKGREFDIYPGGLIPGIEIIVKSASDTRDSMRQEVKRIAYALSSKHFENVLSIFSNKFQVVGTKNFNDVKSQVTETEQIVKLIRNADAQYGLKVHNQFGGDWDNEGTEVIGYFFKISTVIFNSQGEIIWEFCGKGETISGVGFSLKSFVDGFFGTVSLETFVKEFKDIYTDYPKFLLSLMECDSMDKQHGSKLADYIKSGGAFKKFSVYNCNDEKKLPKFPFERLINKDHIPIKSITKNELINTSFNEESETNKQENGIVPVNNNTKSLDSISTYMEPNKIEHALFDVTNINYDDFLAIRSKPDFKSDKVGEIPPDGKNILSLGDSVLVGEYWWIKIKYNYRQGWVNSNYLKNGNIVAPINKNNNSESTVTYLESNKIEPVLFDVTKIRFDDVLTIRSKPDFKSDKVGEIPPDGKNILSLGDSVLVGEYWWIKIKYNYRQGWVNSHYIKVSESKKE